MKTFKTNTEISGRSICDHNCIFTAKVIKRTEKTVTIITQGQESRCKIHIDKSGEEFIFPFGRYSMAPIMRAV